MSTFANSLLDKQADARPFGNSLLEPEPETELPAKPVTFADLYGPQAGRSLTERAARMGAPSPGERALAPEYSDLTAVPRSPFTGELETLPPMLTEEEKQRAGTIGPREQTIGERVERALGAGAPEGSKMAEWTGQRGTKDNLRLFAPEQLMTESEQLRHPVLTGAGEFAGGFTSPEGIMLLAGTAGAGQLAGPAAQTVKQLLAAGFTTQMLASAAQQVPEVEKAISTGDTYNAQRLLTHLALTSATAGLASRGMLEEPTPTTVPKGTISSKLAMDEAIGRSARRMQEFAANDAARSGMGNLAEAERGIEAARQARIDAPVEVPKTYEGEPPILPRRPQGPERNPLEVEAQRVREEQAARERPAFTVKDLRRVVPEDLSEILESRKPTLPREDEGRPSAFGLPEEETTLPKEDEAREGAVPAKAFGLPDLVDPRELALGEDHNWVNPEEVQERIQQIQAGQEPRVTTTPEGEIIKGAQTTAAAELLGLPVQREIETDVAKGAGGAAPRLRDHYFDREEPTPARVGGDRPFEGGEPQGEKPFPTVAPGDAFEHKGANEPLELPRQLESEMPIITERQSAMLPPIEGEVRAKVAQRFPADVIDAAEAELRAAAGLAGSFERPGRYFAEYGDQKDYMPSRSTNAAKGIHAGGTWYGVSSSRGMIEDMHPWYADVAEGPETLSKIVQRGQGAAYDRLLERAATHIQNERESARPITEEYAPQLNSLAGQIHDIDPDLAQTLRDIADGKAVGFRNLEGYIREKINDADAAARFSKAVDEAAAEASGSPSAEEPSRLGGETRAGEGVLPGFAEAVEEQAASARRFQAEQLSQEMQRPLADVEAAAGEMERTSPLFRGTAASPQAEMFEPRSARPRFDEGDSVTITGPVGERIPGRVVGAAPGGFLVDTLDEHGNVRDRMTATAEMLEKPEPKQRSTDTTLYSGLAFLDPAAWRAAFPGATQALSRFGKTELGSGDVMKGILREQTGELARRKEQLYQALEARTQEWDARPEREQLNFILREQRGEKQLTRADQAIADQLRSMFADRRQQIESLGHGAFNRWRENYFPQMWERPDDVRDWVTNVLAGERLEGPKTFTKQRVFEDIQQGIDAGFKPLTTNPITLALAKLHEMDRYAMAHTTLDAMKQSGLAKPVMVGQQAPTGWTRLDDRIGTIYGSPNIAVKEAYDQAVWEKLSSVAKNLGIEHEREVGIGGKRLGYATPGKITTRFATPESVIAHEIGHNLDWKYSLKDQLVKNPLYAKELRALADLHIEGMDRSEVPASFQRYIRKGSEKMATMVEALVHVPDKFREVAPNTWDFLQKFIADKPELKPLLEAKPSLRYGTRTGDVSAGGMVIHGYYYAPEAAARVFNNHLSPGLQGFKTYNAVRMMGNTLNQAQLGLSAFHLGFTSLDASVSDMALALERLSRGEVARSLTPAMRSVTILGSPINTMMKGSRLLREYMEPGKFAEMAKLSDAVAQAGGRVHMDPFYKNQAIESFWKTWKAGSYAKAGLRAFPAAMEYAAKPVMEFAVPRMKLGVFANLAEDVLARADRENWSREQTRFELNRAWDSVDNRMGQIVYDNLFWNRAVKDLGLVSVRSLGWNLGTAREIGGGGLDFARQAARLAGGEKAELTHRMAYVMALPLVVGFTGAVIHFLSTGKKPETLTDYFFPQTGKLGADGRPERLSLPSYLKDLYELNRHPARTALNKVHPAITATAQFLGNKDYFGTEIHHPDDPFLQQRLDDLEFIGKQFLPFSARNAYLRAESAGDSGITAPLTHSLLGTAESFVGLTPAPRSLGQSPAERITQEAATRMMPTGPRTREEAQRNQVARDWENRLRQGTAKKDDLRRAVRTGKLSVEEGERIWERSKLAPLINEFKRLPLQDALRAYSLANDAEQAKLRPWLRQKAENVRRENYDVDEWKQLRKSVLGIFRPESANPVFQPQPTQ